MSTLTIRDDPRRVTSRAQALFELVEAHYKQVAEFIGDGPESGALAPVLDVPRSYERQMGALLTPHAGRRRER